MDIFIGVREPNPIGVNLDTSPLREARHLVRLLKGFGKSHLSTSGATGI